MPGVLAIPCAYGSTRTHCHNSHRLGSRCNCQASHAREGSRRLYHHYPTGSCRLIHRNIHWPRNLRCELRGGVDCFDYRSNDPAVHLPNGGWPAGRWRSYCLTDSARAKIALLFTLKKDVQASDTWTFEHRISANVRPAETDGRGEHEDGFRAETAIGYIGVVKRNGDSPAVG